MHTVMHSPVAPALRALGKLREEITENKRIGKPGGNLNEKALSWLDTIETTLLQIQPLSTMLNVINQQTEVAVRGFRALTAGHDSSAENGDDDGTSETKGA